MKSKAPSSRRAIAMLAVWCGILAAGIALFAMCLAWNHNPEGRFHLLDAEGTHVIHFGAWCVVGATWFLATFVPPFLVGSGFIALSPRFSSRKSGTSAARLRDPAP